MPRKSLAVGCLLVVIGLLFAGPIFAQVNISTTIPNVGQPLSNAPGPCAVVFNFYTFALALGGVLAFAAITYGGIKYTLAAGNPSKQSDGKEWVKGALYGLLLLVGAYLILNLINPKLTQCGLPSTLAQVPSSGSGGNFGGGTTTTSGGCLGGTCSSLTAAGLNCKNAASCTAAPAEIAVLQCIQQASGGQLRITEAYPPTVPHLSPCHQNGCCVDLTPASGQNASCAQVQSIIQAAQQQCGAIQVLNEWSTQCGGTQYSTTNGYNIHIQGC